MKESWFRRLIVLVGMLIGPAASASAQTSPDWTEAFPPFRIAGEPVLSSAARGLANYLVTTPQGHILVNSDLEANVPLYSLEGVEQRLQVHRHQDPVDQPRSLRSLTPPATRSRS